MRKNIRQRNTRGFTMTEAVAAVAILAVLMAIVIPGVAAIQRRMEMARLDAYARQIFLAAQNELTAMRAGGDLQAFSRRIQSDPGSLNLQTCPEDYPDADGESWKNLYAVSYSQLQSAGDSVGGATDAGGAAYLELDPDSGSVYSVFYAETVFTYEDGNMPRAQKDRERNTPRLGYYSGGTTLSGGQQVVELQPKVEIVNGEELFVKVSCKVPTMDTTKMALTIFAKGETSGKEKLWQNVGLSVDAASMATATLILDSLKAEDSFAKLTEGSGLLPGENLTVTASLTYTDAGGTITGSGSAYANSLFGKREDNGDLTVFRVRHLNNLRASAYGTVLRNGTEAVTITQTSPIDFDWESWIGGTDYLSFTAKPLDSFEPVENGALLNNANYIGNRNALSGFPIRGSGGNTGLFASVTDCTLTGVRLENCSVSGGNNVGALAGSAKNTQVTDCGAYLTYQENDMEQWVTDHAVTGNTNVGGLIGSAEGCTAAYSFAALNVAAVSMGGGLIGTAEGGTVQNCYASGDVTVTGNYGGGLAGYGSGTFSVQGGYTTSDVTAADYTGGILGGGNGSISGAIVYGNVEKETHSGIISGDAAVCVNCRYLKQTSYNSGFTEPSGVQSQSYQQLKTEGYVNGKGTSAPYAKKLQGNYFPFPLLKQENGSAMVHYGDWPEEYDLQSIALVYYEKYQDGSYGYYAQAYLTPAGSGSGAGAVAWTADSLRDEVCTEDGYALVSTTELSKFEYSLDATGEGTATASGTVSIVTAAGAAAADNSLRLTANAALTFDDPGSDAYYTINNANVYRLPFGLQVTERKTSKRFWETLTVTAYGTGGSIEAEDVVFYYCPDFAKNAVNPDPSAAGSGTEMPEDPYGQGVYVRSARQLNGLGRSTFYWNDAGGAGKLTFIQETNIDFGLYTKNYCGRTFDLMDTSKTNEYRNQPIGRPNVSGSVAGNFRNIYDGQGNRIIDYCCLTYDSDNQFTGLFGEVQGGILRNIVLMASDPENGSGYVESRYERGGYRGGVGALAGLLYVDAISDYSGQVAKVENCAVSGYTVSYTGIGACAVGGLAGYCFGNVQDSSAVCKTVSGPASNSYVGGMVGSLNGQGSITNSYAGMTELDGSDVGGIRGGFDNIYGAGSWDTNSCETSITDCYSFWKEGESPYYPITANETAIILKVYGCEYLRDSGKTQSGLGEARSYQELTAKASGSSADHSYPWMESLQGRNYPFRAVVTSTGGKLVHYGNWPYVWNGPHLVYYEKSQNRETGAEGLEVFYLDENGDPVNGLDMTNEKTILAAGYGVLSDQGRTGFTLKAAGDAEAAQGSAATGETLGTVGVWQLYPLTETWTQKLRVTDGNVRAVSLGFTAEGGTRTETRYVNTAYGASIFNSADGRQTEPFQVRTAEQLQRVDRSSEIRYFQQTHDITATGETGSIQPAASGEKFTYDGRQNPISGLGKALFDTVQNATLTNIRLDKVAITSGTGTAPLALTLESTGSVTNCSAAGSVESTAGNAAGLVLNNRGRIQTSYANCRVKGLNAAGFVWVNKNGTIVNCYAGSDHYQNGSISATGGSAFGFVGGDSSGGSISKCYTVAEVSGTARSCGFGPLGGGVTYSDCFWAKDKGLNEALIATGSSGTASKLSAIQKLVQNGTLNSSVWTTDNAGHSYPNSSGLAAYPYPRLIDLDHYGDWPVGKGGKVGAAVLYRYRQSWTNYYYANGCAVNRENGDVEPFPSVQGNRQNTGLILLDESLGLSDWTVQYKNRNMKDWADFSADELNPYGTELVNVSGYTVYSFSINKGVGNQLKGVRLINNKDTSEVYTFGYDGNTFTYS